MFGSQPNLAFSGYQPPPPGAGPRSVASGSNSSPLTGTGPTSRPLRQSLYSYAANPNQAQARGAGGFIDPSENTNPNTYGSQRVPFSQRQYGAYANDDINVNDGQTRFVPHRGARDGGPSQTSGGVYTSTCPLCGSSTYHSHGDFVYPPEDNRQPLGYLVNDGRYEILESINYLI